MGENQHPQPVTPDAPDNPVEAIVFDAEGVIIDTEPVWDEGQRAFLVRRGISYDRDRVKSLLTGRSLLEGTEVLMDMYDIGGDPAELARERADLVRHLMTEVDFIPGFPRFFDRVRKRYGTCVATAMDADLFEVVDRSLGIRRLFEDRVYTLEDVQHRSKPDPSLFLFAASSLDTPPSKCCVIEDSPLGVEAAHGAGMRVIGLATTYAPDVLAAADRVVASYEEIDAGALISGGPADGGEGA